MLYVYTFYYSFLLHSPSFGVVIEVLIRMLVMYINELANKSSTKNKPGGDCPSNALAIHFWMEALLPDGRDTDGRAAPLPPDNSDCDSIHSNVDG